MKLRLTLRGAPRRRCSDYYLDRIDGLDGFDASADNSAAPDAALFSGVVPGAPYWAVSYAGWQWIGAYLVLLLSGFVLYRCFKRAGKHSAAARAHRLFHLNSSADEQDIQRITHESTRFRKESHKSFTPRRSIAVGLSLRYSAPNAARPQSVR